MGTDLQIPYIDYILKQASMVLLIPIPTIKSSGRSHCEHVLEDPEQSHAKAV